MDSTLHISDYLPIKGKSLCSIGNRWHHNFGDELILIGLIKLLLGGKRDEIAIQKLYISWGDLQFLSSFHQYFFTKHQLQSVSYIQEIPHGIRSGLRFVTRKLKDFFRYLACDTFVIGWGELFTEETPGSYLYRYWSLLPYRMRSIFAKTDLYVMWWMQSPKTWYNKMILRRIVRSSKQCFLRDEESVRVAQQFGWDAQWFIDTSYFVPHEDRKQQSTKKYIIVNTNPLSDKRTVELRSIIHEYHVRDYDIYFLPAFFTSNSQQDDMLCYDALHADFAYIMLLDWRDRELFVDVFQGAEKIFCSRLHVFLMSAFWGKDVQAYPYQKKITKNRLILEACWVLW